MEKSLLRMVGHELARFRPWPFCPTNRLLGNPAACRGHTTDGVSPRGVAVHYSTGGGEAVALTFGRPRGSNPVVDIT